ncbi:NUDIX domain-containing protein [Parasedimentitalea marina]|uniref:NUDIX domain-containing protein n=1 Tax=Parasedimentitalea marina TaxID=2483033 RepID=A0A3T0MYD9_9RHOB|nr:NUDIX hydrolase [Parasedimentitalea marina]AZV76774.1 NUDIX domain-containing protein [Parasedimentitalea marina]
MNRPLVGAIAVVCHRDRIILVQRGKQPSAGMWGFPGGHLELGETALQAAARELLEETGVTAHPLDYLTNIDVILRDTDGVITQQYLLAAVLCEYQQGTPQTADDAEQAQWIAIADLDSCGLPLLDQVAEVARLAQTRMQNR